MIAVAPGEGDGQEGSVALRRGAVPRARRLQRGLVERPSARRRGGLEGVAEGLVSLKGADHGEAPIPEPTQRTIYSLYLIII